MLSLDDLDEAEQRILYDQLAYRFSKQPQTISADEGELWDAIIDALGLPARERPPLKNYIQAHGKARYIEHVEAVESLISRALPEMVRRPVKASVRRRMLTCLAKYLRAINVPPTPTTMVQNLGRLEYAVDACYPGYINARLLHRIAPLAVAEKASI
jgi:hypothetical protein